VLLLRAAVRRPQARPRRHVARLLDRPLRHVTRLERSGLHRLRALNRRSGCGRSSAQRGEASSVPATYRTTTGGFATTPDSTTISSPGGSGEQGPGQGQVLEEHASGGPDKPRTAKPEEARPAVAPKPPLVLPASSQGGGVNVPLLILAVGLSLFGALALREAIISRRGG
jgi:hypothetical protein